MAESVLVALISAMFTPRSVLIALVQTVAATVGLSLYAMQPNPSYDLSAMGSFLGSALMIFLMFSLGMIFFRIPAFEGLLSSVGALLFSGFIIYDTRRICDGEHSEHRLQSHQYIMGAMALYMDIINLFIYLLRLFGERE